MDMQKINALAENKEFLEAVKNMKTVEEVTAAVNAQGIDITVEQMEEALETYLAQNESGELSEESLDDVSGGVGPGAWILCGVLIWCAVSVVCGALAGFSGCAKKKR